MSEASASGKAGGFLALDWCDGSPLGPLARRSFALHAELAERLGGTGWGYRHLDSWSVHASEDGPSRPRGAGGPAWLGDSVFAARLLALHNQVRAAANVPPLAWDDIDNDLQPQSGDGVDLDEVVVDRILGGERLPATPAEKVEVVRRWLATGRRLADLERLTGWNGKREKDRAFAAEGAA